VTVTTDQTNAAGTIVDAAVASGVTSIGGVTFGMRDDRGARREALAAAVADAQAQARALADAAHVRLGRVVRMAPPGYAPGPRPMVLQQIGRTMATPTNIEPSDLTVTASVDVTYAIVSP